MDTLFNVAAAPTPGRPKRYWVPLLVRNFEIMVVAFICCALPVATWPHILDWTFWAVGGYLAYNVVRLSLQKWAPRFYNLSIVQIIRALVLTVGIASLIRYLYLDTDYLQLVGRGETLWLLLALVPLIMIRRSTAGFVILSTALSVGILVFINLMVGGPDSTAGGLDNLRLVTIQSLWLIFLTLTMHIQVRVHRDKQADIEFIQELERQLRTSRTLEDERSLLQNVLARLAVEFGYAHVNYFRRDQDGQIWFVAGVTYNGKTLSPSLLRGGGYCAAPNIGIIGHVSEAGAVHISNDVARCAYYQTHPQFLDTQSELAAPVTLDGDVVGVLDIQARKRGAFLDDPDGNVAQIMADYVGVVLDKVRLREMWRGVGDTIAATAISLRADRGLSNALRDVAHTALDVLQADLVVIYARNSRTDEIIGPAYWGKLKGSRELKWTRVWEGSLVRRLLGTGEEYFQDHNAIVACVTDPVFGPDGAGAVKGSFVEEQEIRARAIVPIWSNVDCVGLMFVNYRVAHGFRQEEDRNIIRTFANLAGLVVQKVQWQHRQAEDRQQELVRLTHDDLMAKIDGAARSIATVLTNSLLTPVHHAHLENSLGALEESQGHLRFLTDTFRAEVSEDFLTELDQVVTRISTAWNTQIELKCDPECRHLPDRLFEPLLDVLTEALRNAASYSKAAAITVEIECCADSIRGIVQDNGRGFNPRFIRPRGLESIRRTLINLGGTYEQVTSRGEGAALEVGTRILFTVPLEDVEKENHHAGS